MLYAVPGQRINTFQVRFPFVAPSHNQMGGRTEWRSNASDALFIKCQYDRTCDRAHAQTATARKCPPGNAVSLVCVCVDVCAGRTTATIPDHIEQASAACCPLSSFVYQLTHNINRTASRRHGLCRAVHVCVCVCVNRIVYIPLACASFVVCRLGPNELHDCMCGFCRRHK